MARASIVLRATVVTKGGPVYTLGMLQRVTDALAGLRASDRSRGEILFTDAGLSPLLTVKAKRRVLRRDHLETEGDPT